MKKTDDLIRRLRAELSAMVKCKEDLTKPEVLAKSRELDTLVVRYLKEYRPKRDENRETAYN